MDPEHERLIEAQVGKPYRAGANGPDAFDCYGVPFYLMRECGLVPIPEIRRPQDVAPCGDSIADALQHHPELDRWVRVADPQPWDIALMANVVARARHIGLCVHLKGAFWIIHAQDAPVNRVILDDLPSLDAKGFKRISFYRRR